MYSDYDKNEQHFIILQNAIQFSYINFRCVACKYAIFLLHNSIQNQHLCVYTCFLLMFADLVKKCKYKKANKNKLLLWQKKVEILRLYCCRIQTPLSWVFKFAGRVIIFQQTHSHTSYALSDSLRLTASEICSKQKQEQHSKWAEGL